MPERDAHELQLERLDAAIHKRLDKTALVWVGDRLNIIIPSIFWLVVLLCSVVLKLRDRRLSSFLEVGCGGRPARSYVRVPT